MTYGEREALINGLIAEAEALSDDEESWTWLDYDREEAIESPGSYYGKLGAIYERAGWERCYHRGATYHFNVKLNGPGRWRGFREGRNATEDARGDGFDGDEVERIAQDIEENALEWWWEDVQGHVKYELRSSAEVRSCGRSGGYANAPQAETDPETFLKLALYLWAEREGWNSYAAGQDLWEEALAVYDEDKLAGLASPRPERVEA